MRKALLAAGLAGAALLATVGGALAATAYATTTVNVRSGPGPGYGVVDVLNRGERVEVDRCRGTWCLVEKRGRDGWVSSRYLDSDRGWDGPPVIITPRPPVWHPRPPRPPYWGDGRPGWHGRPPHWGDGRPGWHGRPGWGRPDNSFCFGSNNASFCVND